MLNQKNWQMKWIRQQESVEVTNDRKQDNNSFSEQIKITNQLQDNEKHKNGKQ